MVTVTASLVIGLVGILASRAYLPTLTANGASRDPHVYWALGLTALVPAWVVAFVGLLGTPAGARPHLVSAAVWMVSAATGLIGAIATEARVRDAGDTDDAREAARLWRVGLFTFLPAWVIALIGYAVR
jgi:hypothetical protein